MLDLKIVGGTVVDGSGSPRFRADLGIKDDRIVAIGTVEEDARQVIDATGMIIAPGFVDVHTHYDAQVFWDPILSPSCYHGVTTVLGGNCGFTIAPLSANSGEYLRPMLARVEGMPLESLVEGVPWNWRTFGEYLSRFEGSLAINAGFLAGHSAIRRHVMGECSTKREATADELRQMKELLRQSIREGALGFSSSLSVTHNDADGGPVPSRFASRTEVLELFGVISEFEGTVAELLPSINFTADTYDLLTEASLSAKRPVNWNVASIRAGTPDELKTLEYKLAASDYARERGAEVIALAMVQSATARVNFVSGFVFDALPGWAPLFQMPLTTRMEKLRDPGYRAQLKESAKASEGPMRNFAAWANYIVVETFAPANKKYEGRRVGDIAAEEGRDAFDVLIEIVLADELKTSLEPEAVPATEEVYRRRAELWTDSRAVVGASDAGAHLDMIDTFMFTTSLLRYGVRVHGVISLEDAVHHLTQRPATLVGLRGRGLLKTGYFADIVVFDADKVGAGEIYTRTDLPAGGARLYAEAEGIHHVIVNGREIIRDNQYLGKPAGVVLRPGRDTYTVHIPADSAKPEPEYSVV